MNQTEQQFLKSLENKLWTAADKLRSTLDASQYKHAVLGLLFVKYVSDSFTLRQNEIKTDIANPEHEYYLNPEDFGGEESEEYLAEVAAELEVRDFYTEKNIFWLPIESRWQFLQDNGPLVIGGAELDIGDKKKKITSVGHLIDNALEAIERDNIKLKGVLINTTHNLKLTKLNLMNLSTL
jgi:type I restriction enzyme M protein